ncbi:ATP-binding protein [Kordiimonas lipolytica]|uniref:Oxygen sensor histidine kinase NreB n=1 Tax=Kordiimonas lipolytica TaxID=1662421 RepID=A0ABV8U7D8_9PROT|nr:ATP-binding protein [Kordiimonas lipolytica]
MPKFLSTFLTLRGRLVFLICLATLPAILFAFYLAHTERTSALLRMEQDGHHVISLMTREHLNQMTGAKSLLRWLSGRLARQDSETLISDPHFLAALLAGHPQLGNIAILAPDGEVINSAYPLESSVNMHEYDAVQRALHSQEIETGTYVIGPIVKRPLLHLAYAIRDPRSRVRWVVFVAIDLKWLEQLTKTVELPTDHILLVTDREGRILTGSATSGAVDFSIGTKVSELAGLAAQQDGKTVSAQMGGQSFYFVTASMLDMPGILVANALPQAQFTRKANDIFYRTLGLLGLLTLFTVVSVLIVEEVALLRVIRALSQATQRFGDGDYTVRIDIPRGYGELQDMAVAFNTMAATLMRRHQEVMEAHHQLERLTRHLQVARETEAQRISRDLHDEVGQVLTSIKMDLVHFQNKCAHRASPGTDSVISESIGAIREKIDKTVAFIRRLASDLRPPVLDRMGLSSAIDLLARGLETDAGLVVDVDTCDIPEPLDWLVSTTLYRIVQESLTNILRHAHASEVSVGLQRTDGTLHLSVQDNGSGFDVSTQKGGTLGLAGMRERARLVGGAFAIESEPGRGTKISVSVPVVPSLDDAYSVSA